MCWVIFRKEWQEFYREGRLRWLLAVVLSLLCCSLWLGWLSHTQLHEHVERVEHEERERWLNQGEKNPHSAAHYGVFTFKPDHVLAMFDPGLNAFLGRAIFLEAHNKNAAWFRSAQDAVPMVRWGQLSAAMILQVLVPLLIILCGFHLFAMERERLTLKQVMVAGVSPLSLLMGKALFLLLLLVPVFLVLIVFSVVVYGFEDAADIGRIVTLLVVYSLYLLLWVVTTLVVSIFSATARFSLVILLIAWSLNTLIFPRLAIEWAGTQYPTESAQSFYNNIEQQAFSLQRYQQLEKIKQALLAKHGVDHVNKLPVNWAGIELQFGEEYANSVYDKFYATLFDVLKKQSQVYQLAGFVAPLIAVQSLSMAAAASDLFHHHHFSHAVEVHRRTTQKILNADIANNTEGDRAAYSADKRLWEKVTPLNYQYPEFFQVIMHYRIALGSIVFWCVVVMVFVWIAIRRLQQEGCV